MNLALIDAQRINVGHHSRLGHKTKSSHGHEKTRAETFVRARGENEDDGSERLGSQNASAIHGRPFGV